MGKIKRIVLDMDGVLAAFRQGVLSWLDLELDCLGEEGRKVFRFFPYLPERKQRFLRCCVLNNEDFWATLPEYPWTTELYGLCTSLAKTCIVTKPWKAAGCYSGKYRWIMDRFGEVDHMICEADKSWFDDGETLIIDDKESNLEKFQHSFLWPMEWNDGRNLTANKVELFLKESKIKGWF